MLSFYCEKRKTAFSAPDCCKKPQWLACSAHLHSHIEPVFMIEGDTLAPAYPDREPCRL